MKIYHLSIFITLGLIGFTNIISAITITFKNETNPFIPLQVKILSKLRGQSLQQTVQQLDDSTPKSIDMFGARWQQIKPDLEELAIELYDNNANKLGKHKIKNYITSDNNSIIIGGNPGHGGKFIQVKKGFIKP